jgi:hypothetical protein
VIARTFTIPRRHVLIGAGVFAAIVLVAVTRRDQLFRETSDGAILEIYVLEALRGRLLLGPYSRFGWHHPGPLYFYLLAPWYWLSGLHTAGMQAGAMVINLAAMGTIVRTLTVQASAPVAIAVSGLTAWYALRAGDMLVSAWNPHVIVLPLVAYVVLAAAMAARPSQRRLLGLVFLGIFLAQTHLAMIPIVAVLGLPAAWRGRTLAWTTWAAAGGLACLLWLPALVEQFTHHPGNIMALVQFFLGGGRGQPYPIAVSVWASTLTAAFRTGFAPALGADSVSSAGSVLPFVVAGLVVVLAMLAAKCRRPFPFEAWLLAMCGLTSIVALIATTRIQDRIIDHEVFWMSGIGALSIGSLAGAVVAIAVGHRDRFVSRIASPACVVAWAILAIAGADGINNIHERRRTLDDHAVDVLTEQIETYGKSPGGGGKPLFEIDPAVWPIAAGALLEVDKTGARFAVGTRWVPMFGERFAPTGEEDRRASIAGSAVATTVTPLP